MRLESTDRGFDPGWAPNLQNVILDTLQRTAAAHGEHERRTGAQDPDWTTWYAAHMTRSLEDAGYRLVRR
ncbi:hypothetical protein [Naasia aerilata]|uniref:Uncharacterized protein n=1 Tax=Naasia aerilata TaxID=1162966 RepID=A0ABM8G8G6_9MICO|nr:hypothetical protein [Naasia aerilata]BDZ44482.1 hypothetical protein GCM10025866_03910 [Naasia aerilata]